MKKIVSILLVVLLIGVVGTGCSQKRTDKKSEETLMVVTTIFPEYDWVREITKGNDNVDITLLLDNGVDLHSFQPSADDIIKIGTCDIFIYIGGESDSWVNDTLSQATNKDMIVVNLLEVLGDSVKEEELIEGMEGEEEESHKESHEESHKESHEEEEIEYDEHVWLSLKNAKVLCEAIKDAFVKADANNKELYENNTQAYIEELDALDADYAATVEASTTKTILFGDRFPFRYMTDDYGLDYYAAFLGCSAESEASFETITFLANKVDELKLTTILQIENSDGRIAETIRDTTANKNQQIRTMNSMQSVTSKDVADGVTYLTLARDNLEVLKQTLQ